MLVRVCRRIPSRRRTRSRRACSPYVRAAVAAVVRAIGVVVFVVPHIYGCDTLEERMMRRPCRLLICRRLLVTIDRKVKLVMLADIIVAGVNAGRASWGRVGTSLTKETWYLSILHSSISTSKPQHAIHHYSHFKVMAALPRGESPVH